MTKVFASDRLRNEKTNPHGAMSYTFDRYCLYACADAGWCSATESTKGLPVRVCLTNSERIRDEIGPK